MMPSLKTGLRAFSLAAMTFYSAHVSAQDAPKASPADVKAMHDMCPSSGKIVPIIDEEEEDLLDRKALCAVYQWGKFLCRLDQPQMDTTLAQLRDLDYPDAITALDPKLIDGSEPNQKVFRSNMAGGVMSGQGMNASERKIRNDYWEDRAAYTILPGTDDFPAITQTLLDIINQDAGFATACARPEGIRKETPVARITMLAGLQN
jgi:hypothetical protein